MTVQAAIKEHSVMERRGFLAIWSDVPPEIETDYLHWLTREHTHERLGVDGFLGVRVYRALRKDVRRYFIHYELASSDILSSASYLERLNAPTPWSQRIMPILGNFVRGGGTVVAEAGTARGCVLAVIKLQAQPHGFHRERLQSIAASDRIIAAQLLETDRQRTTIATREKSMRTQDDSFARLLLVEGLDELGVLNAIARNGIAFTDALYAQIFQL
jgi:hypothetical protein